MYTDFDVAQKYVDTAYHLVRQIDYPYGEARSIYYQAQNHALNNYYKEGKNIRQGKRNSTMLYTTRMGE